MHDAQRALGEQVGRGIDVPGVLCAERERRVREAVRGDVARGGGEDAAFDGGERRWRGRVVVAVEGSRA